MARAAVKIGFRQEVLEIPIEQLVALKETNAAVTGCRKSRWLFSEQADRRRF